MQHHCREHVSEAERGIRTIKEHARGLITTLPFEHIPQRMKIEFIYFCVLWLNAFPVKSGISSSHSPRELMVHWKLDYKRHCRVQPGTYCEVHDEPIPSNRNSFETYREYARQREILLPHNGTCPQTTILHAVGNAG